VVVLLAGGYATPFSHCVLEHNYNTRELRIFLILTFFNRGVKLSSTIIIIAKKTYETLFLDTVVPLGYRGDMGAGVCAQR
jgi:hypothetical protein